MSGPAIGIDKARGGWIAVTLHDGRFHRAQFVERLAQFDGGDARHIAIDIPLSFPSTGRRPAELEARRLLGRRASTLFLTPPADVVSGDWNDARAAGVSKQMWNLTPSIHEAREVCGDNWIEAHPELVFVALAGGELAPKKTWNGQRQRLGLLEAQGVHIPDDLGNCGRVAPDDVLDAGVCAILADRHPGSTRPLGGDPAVAIWTLRDL